MTACTLGDLNPAAREALDEYLTAVGGTVDAEFRDAVVCDLRTWMLDHLNAGSSPDDVRALIERAGPVTDAEDADADPQQPHPWGAGFDPRGAGERVATTWWAPADPRLLLPRAFGLGWDLNLGAVAVRLGLIEPDAEDVPFESTPQRAFPLAAAVPGVLAAAVVAHYAVRGRSLPDPLPAHWGWAGEVDRWTPRARAALTDLLLSVVPAALAGTAAFGRRSNADKAGSIALLSSLAGAGAGITVLRSLGERPGPWVGPAQLAATLGAPAVVLFGLARAGRRAEQRRDLG